MVVIKIIHLIIKITKIGWCKTFDFQYILEMHYNTIVLFQIKHTDHFIQVTDNSTVVYSASSLKPATRLSFAEVVCPLDEHNFDGSSGASRRQDTYIARGYSIAIANDGIHFGESDSIVIYNSSCVNCTKTENEIECYRDVSLN